MNAKKKARSIDVNTITKFFTMDQASMYKINSNRFI